MMDSHSQSLNSKDIFLKTVNLEDVRPRPAAPHWWGVYKYEALGLDYRTAAWQAGDRFANHQ